MNIFKALSEGNGRISETNITSFMNYLFDSSNELNNSFFVLFSNLIDQQLENNTLSELLGLSQKTIRNQITYFTSDYTISSEPEYSIQNKNGNKQIPDILVRIQEKNSEDLNDIAYLIIENKINKSAIKKGQIETQFEYFINSGEFDSEKPIYSVLITPDDDTFSKLHSSAILINEKTIWLKWVNHADPDISIEGILRKLIKHEQNAEIEPINPNTQFIFKSFIDYIASEFSEKESNKKNYSFKGFKEMSRAKAILGKETYYIKRFSNNMVRLFDEDGNLLELEVKPILRKINKEYNLNIELLHSTGKAKNTQILGREIINKLSLL